MGKITIPGTSVTYENPMQLNASSIDPKTGAPWVPWPVASGTTSWGGCLVYPAPYNPQPGTFEISPPHANKVLFNQQPPSLSSGA
jgi:hypothetical protein